MTTRQYIGARYVPKFANPIEHDPSLTYEPLVIVTYQGNSYTSRTFVPAGTPITDDTYWALTGNYNAQVEAYRQDVLSLSENLNNIKCYVTPAMFKGELDHDDTQALQLAINYAYDHDMIVFAGSIEISGHVQVKGHISNGDITMKSGSMLVTSDAASNSISIDNIDFDVSAINTDAIRIKSNNTTISKCSFKGNNSSPTVKAISISPYIDESEEFYNNTYGGIFAANILNNYFAGVHTAIYITNTNTESAWINGINIKNNSGMFNYRFVDIDGQYISRNNINGININENEFIDNFTSDVIRYGIKISNVIGTVNSLNNKLLSDGDDVNYYAYYQTNDDLNTNTETGYWLERVTTSHTGMLFKNGTTDGKVNIIQGLCQDVFSRNYPSLRGIAKNLLYHNDIENVGDAITYANNQLTFTHGGSVTNAAVNIPIPSDMESDNHFLGFLAICDFDVSTATGHRPSIVLVNGESVTSAESLGWPGNGFGVGNICGGYVEISNTVETSLRLRFLNFPAGTYVVKALILFNSEIGNLKYFTDNFNDISMFDYD